MPLWSKLKIESAGMFAVLAFYAVAGIIFLAVLPLAEFAPHVGIIGIFSLITSYGMFRKRKWAIWCVVILFFTATTFSAYMLYYLLGDYVLGASALVYLILTWVFTFYALARRKSIES